MFKTVELQNKKYLRVDFVSPSIFRIRLSENNVFEESPLVRYGIVSAECQTFPVKESKQKESVSFITGKAYLGIDLKSGKTRLIDSGKRVLLSPESDPESDKSSGFDLSFRLDKSDKLYGFGDATRANIQKRGLKNNIVLMNVSAYTPIPFVMSKRGWGLFINSTFFHSYDAGVSETDVLRFHSDKGLLDYFLIAGDSLPDILDKYTDITGKPHLLPKWGYGLTFVCDERGVRARDVLYEAYEFRRQNIPCDTIGLEPDWMEKCYDFSVEKEWSKERFHIPAWLKGKTYATFDAALRNMKFKLSLWLCCDYDFSEYEETILSGKKESGAELQTIEAGIFNDPHFAPQYFDKITKRGEPWFEHLKKFVDDGASAFKLDGANQVCFHPDRKWKNGMEDCEMHNLYPLLYNKQMSLGFKEYTGRRPMIFSACGYAGIQKYSATWAGDTGGGADTLVSLLNHGLSGHSNVCTDMEVHTKSGIHYGFFQTLSQVLSWHMYNQPWFLGEELAEMFKFYAQLRYKLIPYIYSCASNAASAAMPVMRAMPLAFPDDEKCDSFIHQYMFGDFFLVSAFEDKVYLPEGEWIDFWTGKMYKGKQVIPSEFPENRGGSVFVKAGAIIPTQKVKNSIGTDSPEEIIWEVWPKGKSEFTLIEDDGESYEYLEGKSTSTRFECVETKTGFEIKIHPRKGGYKGMPENRCHTVKIFSTENIHLKSKGFTLTGNPGEKYFTVSQIMETRGILDLEFVIK